MIENISCVEIDTPSESFFNFSKGMILIFATFSQFIFDFWISTPFLKLWVLMLTLNFLSSVWTLCFPSSQKTKLTKIFSLWQFLNNTNTIRSTFHWNFQTSNTLLNTVIPGSRRWHIMIYLLIFSKIIGYKRPIFNIYFKINFLSH